MKAKTLLVLLTLILLFQCTNKDTNPKPPLAEVSPVEDKYFGVKVLDPYRYMENLNDSSVQLWIKAQSDYSRSILNSIPGRLKLLEKMKEFDDRKSSQTGIMRITDNDRYFYLKFTPEDETGKLYYRDGYNGKETLLYDPDNHTPDTIQKFVINSFSPSTDGSNIAFEITPSGLESSEIVTMDVNSQKIFPERIDRYGFASPSWLPDGNGYLYNRLQSNDVHRKDRELDSKTYLHIIGTDPATDKEIFSRVKYPELGINPSDFPTIVYDKNCNDIFGSFGKNVYYAPSSELVKEKIAWKHLFKPEDEVKFFETTDKEIYVYTSKDAPNLKILKILLTNSDLGKAEVVVPEDNQNPLRSFRLTCDGLYYILSENGVKQKLYFLKKGEETGKEIILPIPAGLVELRTKGFKYSDVWIGIYGWTSDYQRYRYSPQKNEFSRENLSSIAEYPEYADLIVEELMIPSYDGSKVPLSLIYKKGIKKNGRNPVFIKGYGAYGYSMNPVFNPNLLLWTYYSGIFAVAHVRGGGELGSTWYKSGLKITKPNSWKDLIACAEYLINENYTSPKKISIDAVSAGGILIGRAMTERPGLFAAAIPEIGVMNPLRFEETPNGPANLPEFGTVIDSVECMALIEMDSYLHIKDGVKYPATLVTAGMNDTRVIAWQPAKFAARLQAANTSDKPVLFWIDYTAGHGADIKTKIFESQADVLSFALWQTGHPKFRIK